MRYACVNRTYVALTAARAICRHLQTSTLIYCCQNCSKLGVATYCLNYISLSASLFLHFMHPQNS